MRVTETHLLLAYIMVNYFVSIHNIYLTERERENVSVINVWVEDLLYNEEVEITKAKSLLLSY